MATQAVLDAVKNDNLNACVVHPSGILGLVGYVIGETTKGQLIINAVEKGVKGECYILTNEKITFKNFSKLVAKEAGLIYIYIIKKKANLIINNNICFFHFIFSHTIVNIDNNLKYCIIIEHLSKRGKSDERRKENRTIR